MIPHYDGNKCVSQRGYFSRFLLHCFSIQYVDLGYQGGGVGEYMYYDRHKGVWDDYACQRNPGGRCVKMDCHLPDTHFSLLGFFKEPRYDEWMEQLFKHEGDCVWSDKEYTFMQQYRAGWPTSCTQSLITENGKNLYYDTKPGPWGTMGIGIYTDVKCIQEYHGSISIQDILVAQAQANQKQGDDDDYFDPDLVADVEKQLATWNSAFDVFKYCQPCKAYDLVSIVAGSNAERNGTGSRYSNMKYDQQNQQRDDDNNDEGFICADAANYNDVNQCMKFETKTTMLTATFSDIYLAELQGTVAGITIKDINTNKTIYASGVIHSQSKLDRAGNNFMIAFLAGLLWYGWFSASMIWFGVSLYHYRRFKSRTSPGLDEPLVETESELASSSKRKKKLRGQMKWRLLSRTLVYGQGEQGQEMTTMEEPPLAYVPPSTEMVARDGLIEKSAESMLAQPIAPGAVMEQKITQSASAPDSHENPPPSDVAILPPVDV